MNTIDNMINEKLRSLSRAKTNIKLEIERLTESLDVNKKELENIDAMILEIKEHANKNNIELREEIK